MPSSDDEDAKLFTPYISPDGSIPKTPYTSITEAFLPFNTHCCTVCITFPVVSFRFFKKFPAPPLRDENKPPPA
jgi:hypothetical protein